MASYVNLNRVLIADARNISAQMRSAVFTRGRRSKEADTWGQSSRRTGPGNTFAELSGVGFTDLGAAAQDAYLEAMFGASGGLYSLLAEDGSAGKYSWNLKGLTSTYNPFDTSDAREFQSFAFGVQAEDHFGGIVSVNGSVGSTTNGSYLQTASGGLDADANQAHYIVAYCTEVASGSPTFDITLESASDSVFTSPTTRATLTQMTAAGDHEWSKTVPSSDITDEYWRAVVTYGGTGSGTIIACVGVEGPARA